MSSMLRKSIVVLMLGTAPISTTVWAQNAPSSGPVVQQIPPGYSEASQPNSAAYRPYNVPQGSVAQAIQRWQQLSSSNSFSFSEYSSYLLSNPGFPDEEKIRAYAELALNRESPDASRLVAFFDRYPPVTNPARAKYAMALATMRRPEARQVALDAWRNGPMDDASYGYIFSTYARDITTADHDMRMDALLWSNDTVQAQRALIYVSPQSRPAFMSRLAMINRQDPAATGLPTSGDVARDLGFVYNRTRQLRLAGNTMGAASALANRPRAARPARDATKLVGEMLTVAKSTDASTAVRIASSVDDLFEPGADISQRGFKLRDDYTSLMWLGGTQALWSMRDAARAAPLFYRYGAAAKTPQTRSKGFYWAGRALAQRGDSSGANRYFEMAAQYPDHFYGMLAMERLGRPLPRFDDMPRASISQAERAAFNNRPITAAVREVSRGYQWRTTVRFFKKIAELAKTKNDYLMIAELASQTQRRDLAVILGQEAHTDGIGNLQQVSFPTMPTPPGVNWTMTHAITRQESQFAMNAISHAGARGLMQLMPGTAREQAGKMGMGYNVDSLMTDATYNIRLGDGYFARMTSYYNGSMPLAVGAYNAGPGNVNRWLRANGDPRTGSVDWVEWIEKIPIYETRNYVQRVLENAIVYEAMHPDRARYSGPNPLTRIIGKRSPG